MKANSFLTLAAAVVALGAWGCGEAPAGKAYERAVGQLKAGKVAEGCAGLEALLEKEPEGEFAAEAWNWVGLARWETGDLDGAAEAFGAASARDGSDWRPVYNLGMLEMGRGEDEKALELLKQTVRLNPDGTDAMLAMAELLTRRGKWDRAKSVYFQVQKRDAQSAAAMTGLGRALLLEGDAGRAETEFMGALEMDREYGPALYNLGVLHAMEGRADEAAVYFRRYLEASPEGERASAAKERLGGANIPQTGFGGVVATPGSAGALWQKAAEGQSAGDAARALEVALETEDPSGAEIAKRVFAGFPKSAEAQLAAGAYWEKTGNRAGAVEAYRRAAALEPENPEALRAVARAAAAGEEWDTAAMALRRLAKDVEPGNADVWWDLADVYGDKLGMAGRGAAIYKEFARRFPADARAGEVGGRVAALEEEAARAAAEEGSP